MAPIPQQRNHRLLFYTRSVCKDCLVSFNPFAIYFYRLSMFRPMTNGVCLEPTGLRAWLRRRGLHWSCFCPLETGEPLSCQIVHGKNNGHVIAHCGQYPSHCGFRRKSSIFLSHLVL